MINVTVVFFCPPEHRCIESAKIRNKYPDRVPVSDVSEASQQVFKDLFSGVSSVIVVSPCVLPGDCGESVRIADSRHR